MKRRLAVAFGILVVLFFAARPMTNAFIRSMLYPAPWIPVPTPPSPIEEVILDTTEGDRVVVWFQDGPASAEGSSSEGGPWVLFFHGNGENLETLRRSGFFTELAALGVGVAAIDYPGYGRSTGRPGEASLGAAGLAAFDWLRARADDRPVVAMGWSLGAAVAAQVAADRGDHLDALVLLSPWHDLPSVARGLFPGFLVDLLLRDGYASGDRLERFARPALVVHGERDNLIPATEGRRLHERLGTGRFVGVDAAGHNDLLGHRVVWREIEAFLGLLWERR